MKALILGAGAYLALVIAGWLFSAARDAWRGDE